MKELDSRKAYKQTIKNSIMISNIVISITIDKTHPTKRVFEAFDHIKQKPNT